MLSEELYGIDTLLQSIHAFSLLMICTQASPDFHLSRRWEGLSILL